ncbi:MAG: AraC family transcriptional regulator [Spirochaetia bacterium]
MNPYQPELYLDPLLPLSVRQDPATFPRLAHAGRRGLLICSEGGYTVVEGSNRTTLPAPGLMRVDLSAGARLARGGGTTIGGRATTRGWLVVIGGRLLDQLIVATFGEPGFARFLDELDSPGRSACDPFDDDLDLGLADLAAELAERQPAYRVRARLLLTNALLLLYRSTLMTPELSNGDGIRLGAVLDHIELHYAEELSLHGLAELMGTSSSYFSRLFRSEVGIPLFEHINRTRIRKACILLRRPELSVTRIAFDVGYNSVSFFNRYFRRVMNVSPREYRRYLAN